MGPGWGGEKKEIKAIGKDILVAVDLSNSMNSMDVQPSRLEKVKFELKKLVEAFNSDRVGILIFSSEPFVQCPLTYDRGALNLFIETLSTRLVPSGGTQIGPALALASEKLLSDDEKGKSPHAKIILLISDGEDFSQQAEEQAEELKENGIKLFSLGVGTEQGGVIPLNSGQNKKDTETGNDVITKLKSELLKKLSSITGGAYYEINEKENQSPALIKSIDRIAGELQDTKMVDISADKYYYFLIPALGLILLDILITVKTFRINL